MQHVIAGLDADNYITHALHESMRDWPETNCYTDLWIEVLHALHLPPEAMLGFTVRQDFEGDQFTFFKPSLDDIESLYGITTTELAIFDDVEHHAMAQIARGRLPLIEIDSFYLPDTRGIAYRATHGKTTIAINALDPTARRMNYFHNAGYFALAGEDYDGVFGRAPDQNGGVRLFPYAEFAKLPRRLQEPTRATCEVLLATHLVHRPASNPFLAWQRELPEHLEDLLQRPESYFHTYAFNTLRQFGANFDLLASHLHWIADGGNNYAKEIATARQISVSAKAMQFQLARAMARRRTHGLDAIIAPVADAWDSLMAELDARFGARRAA